jgi:hypothetical protein
LSKKQKHGKKYSGGGLHWLKHNMYTDIISRQESHLTMDRHINNEDKNENQVRLSGGH